MDSKYMIGDYLIQQLHAYGVRHIFGVPGDFILGFYDLLQKNPLLQTINTCDEQGAGFAADAYARLNGLGAVCITYGVGGLKVANTTAQALAEQVPVVVISGAPGLQERQKHPLLHHRIRDFDSQRKIFEQLTVAQAILDNPDTALAEIDRVIATALHSKRPVYIELPRDMVMREASRRQVQAIAQEKSDQESLQAALAEAVALLNAARSPVILADVELTRSGMQDELYELIGKTNIPVAATILGKSVVDELHPSYLGVYMGGRATRACASSSKPAIVFYCWGS